MAKPDVIDTSRYAAMFPERVQKLILVEGLGPSPAVMANWNAAGQVKRSREWLLS